MIPLAQPPKKDDRSFDDWMYRMWKRISDAAGMAWALVDKTGSNLTDLETRNHADLQNINTASYTHLSAVDATDLTDGGSSTLHKHSTFHAPLIDGEPNGFVDRTEVTLSWVDATRTLTITPVGASFRIYTNSVLYTKTVAESIVIPNTTGPVYVYYDNTGTLAVSNSFDVALILIYAFVASFYWNATTSLAVPDALSEMHGIEIPAEVHYYLHNSRGTAYNLDGGLLPSVTVDGNGSLLAHVQVATTSGYIWDEDIKHAISLRATTDVIPILYRTGATGVWTFDESSSAIVRTTGTGRAAYNEWTGATWQLTEVSNSDFVLSHLFAIPGLTKKWMVVMGTNIYTTLASARAGAESEILGISGIPLAEFKAIATFVVQTANSYTNAVKSRIRTIDTGVDFIDFRYSTISGLGASSVPYHDALQGLNAGPYMHLAAAEYTLIPTGVPTVGQVPIATSATTSAWGTVSGGSGALFTIRQVASFRV